MKRMLHYVYWTLVFTPGLMELLDWHSGIYRVGFPLVGGLLFLMTLVQNKPTATVKVPLLFPVFAFFAVSVASSIYNDQSLYNWGFFLLFTLFSSYLYFLVVVNEANEKLISSVSKFVAFLILLQIPAVLIKFSILGQSESGAIGTLSVRAGSISTVFPTLVVAFLTGFYFYKRRIIYVLLIILFALFAIIGAKRAIAFFLPAEILLGYILYLSSSKRKISFTTIKNAFVVCFLAGVLIALAIKTIPSLNPEGSHWGTVDFDYVLEHTEDYTRSGYFEGASGTTLQEIRRIEGLQYFIDRVLDYDLTNMMLGDGAGQLVQSRYSESSGAMIDVYGVRYGGRMGFVWLLMQVGILGVLLHLWLFWLLLWKVIKLRHLVELDHKALRLGFILASVFLFLDFMLYSVVSIQTEAVKGVYFFVAALLYRIAYTRNVPIPIKEQQMYSMPYRRDAVVRN